MKALGEHPTAKAVRQRLSLSGGNVWVYLSVMAERLSYPDLLAASGCCILHGVSAEAAPKLTVWQKEHLHPGEVQGAIGGAWTYSYTPTGLGTVVKVSCYCGGSIDLTDYDAW